VGARIRPACQSIVEVRLTWKPERGDTFFCMNGRGASCEPRQCVGKLMLLLNDWHTASFLSSSAKPVQRRMRVLCMQYFLFIKKN